MSGFIAWWDGVEEWLIRLPFVPQLLVTLVVVVPVAIVAAMVLSVVVDAVTDVAARLGSAVSTAWNSQVRTRGGGAAPVRTAETESSSDTADGKVESSS
ncbi:hypothetical protein [Gordonia araii]|uniref:hypothetical protein n=1 Tax=Gordonia araii TaxID=263909 RepID=UPI0002E16630|nr:hypothetical protein [Gordonia araii]NNG96182.1 hypothetical protein [Gordonia araii NBRC 100433]